MNKNKEIPLVELYPDILQDYGKSPQESCLSFGFEHGDGWYELIGDLLKELDNYTRDKDFHVIADQIKEKFGTLRFYYHFSKDHVVDEDFYAVRGIVSRYEALSGQTCEKTGDKGKLCSRGPGGWMKTLSPEKAKELNYKVTPKSQQL